MTSTATHRTAATEAEAAAWIVRLHSQRRTAQLEAGLRRWLEENAENARIFESMTQAWDDATSLAAQEPFPRIRRSDSFPQGSDTNRGQFSRGRPRMLSIAAAVVLVLCGAAAFLFSTWRQNTYTTDIGEQLTLRMKDGTLITLNSGSELETAYTGTARHIQLLTGEAYFEVAKDPTRPFTVTAANRTVTALGTSFLIRTQPKQTAITLIDGKVAITNTPLPETEERGARDNGKVRDSGRSSVLSDASSASKTQHLLPSPGEGEAEKLAHELRTASNELSRKAPTGDANSLQKVILTPGQRLTLATAKTPTIDTPRIDTLTAWRRNEAIFEKTTLTDAIDEMNRYDETQLTIQTPDIDKLQISGIYRTGDNLGFAQTLANIYQLKTTKTQNQIRITQ